MIKKMALMVSCALICGGALTLGGLMGEQYVSVMRNTAPSQSLRDSLALNGAQIIHGENGHRYRIRIPSDMNPALLQQWGFLIDSSAQLSPVNPVQIPSECRGSSTWTLDLYPQSELSTQELSRLLVQQGITVQEVHPEQGRVRVLLPDSLLKEVHIWKWLHHWTPCYRENPEINELTSTGHLRVIYLNQSLIYGSTTPLDGSGITMAIGDNGAVIYHPDIDGRQTNYTTAYDNVGHGTHVTGIAGGAGNKDEKMRGIAPKLKLTMSDFSNAYVTAANDSNTTIVSGSFVTFGALSKACSTMTLYTQYSRQVDSLSRAHPNWNMVFSNGNFGASGCDPQNLGYRTMNPSESMGKNIICVGRVDIQDAFDQASQIGAGGPTWDGRIKPDVVADQNVESLDTMEGYVFKQGSSMSTPNVSGIVALLQQRFKQKYPSQALRGDLVKATLLDGADQIFSAGPNFMSGWGIPNARRSIKIIDDGQFYTGSVSQGDSVIQNITIPAGYAAVNIMLYWMDPPAAANTNKGRVLVNDLDLSVSSGSNNYLPWVLDTNLANAGNAATKGTDHINNVEQVTIATPAAGSYRIKVTGYQVASGPQAYALVYSLVENNPLLVHPIPGESFVPGDTLNVHWDVPGPNFPVPDSLNYSLDSGKTWTPMSTFANYDLSQTAAWGAYTQWMIPNTTATHALIKLKIGINTTTAGPFNIQARPVATLMANGCKPQLTWAAISGASTYAIYTLRSGVMTLVDYTSSTSYTFNGLDAGRSEYWFAVQGLNPATGLQTLRSIAVKDTVSGCTGMSSSSQSSSSALSSSSNTISSSSSANQSSSSGSVTIASLEPISIRLLSQDRIQIQMGSRRGEYFVYDVRGGLRLSGRVETASQVLDLSGLPNGRYLISVWDGAHLNQLDFGK